ncbi:MAG: hypothetical protein KAX49_13900, partial [Halanaerobiales bacterium]|nr:hypothetical protein [Halanaerobiales bacterium]
MRRKLLILFIALILMMTVDVSAYSQVKVLPSEMTDGCQGYFDGMLDDGVVIFDPFNQGSLELVYDFEEQTDLIAIKFFIAEKKNFNFLISYDLGDGYWRNTAEVGEFSLDSLHEGWNRIGLDWNDVERIKFSLSGTSIQTDTGISEIEFWGVNSQETVEIFSADVLGEVEFGKSAGTVQEYTYQIQINRSLIDLEKAELLYQSYDVEGEEGKFSINGFSEYYLTVSTPHLRHQWENIQRLVYPGFIQEGENTLEIKLGDQKKNGFSLKDVGLKLYFDQGEIDVIGGEIYEDGQAMDSSDIGVNNILDGDRETYWESGVISPTEVVIYMNFGDKVWLEAIDIDFELVFMGEVSLEYLRDGIWNSITGWNRRLLNELENGLNEISLGEEGIITEQIRLVLINTVHQPVVGRVRDVKIWGSKYWSDSERPEVVITYPEDKMFVGNHTVLQGYVLNPYTSLTLNDEVLQSEEGVFEEELNLAPERGNGGSSSQNGSESPYHGIADVILEVKGLNASGEEGVDQVQVYMDTPPEVEILSPMDGIYTNVGQVLVEGTVDKGSYDLTINEIPISYYDKQFSFNYWLQPWLNLIKVKAVSLKELIGEAEVRVIYDQNVPLLYFDQEYDGQILGVDSVLISGQVYDYSPVVLKINEQEIPVIQGYFAETFDLSLEGENSFKVEVVDAAGNVLQQEFDIIRDLTPPNQFTPIVDPADWSQVTQPVISFETTDDFAGIKHYELRVENEEWRVVESPYTLSGLEDGVHLVEVKAVDNLGWSRVESVNVYVDTTVPESFQPVAEPAGWTQNVQPIISFETTDLHSGIDHYELSVVNEELMVIESPYTLPELIDGVHTVYVKAIDKVGLSTEEIVKVYIDTTEPERVGGFKGVAGPKEVILTWDKSVEEDVTHYLMYREPEWSTGSEYLSFENTEDEFEYVDYDVEIGNTYKYQLIAVDH